MAHDAHIEKRCYFKENQTIQTSGYHTCLQFEMMQEIKFQSVLFILEENSVISVMGNTGYSWHIQ